MNTQEIYIAQSNVSKQYTVENITNLISRITKYDHWGEVYYNYETRSIDLELSNACINNLTFSELCDRIKIILGQWVSSLPVDDLTKSVICNNIGIIFNITKINDNIVKVYLY